MIFAIWVADSQLRGTNGLLVPKAELTSGSSTSTHDNRFLELGQPFPLQHSLLKTNGDSLGSIGSIQLVEDAGHVVFGSTFSDVEITRYGLVG
jgi:hypothetical protein